MNRLYRKRRERRHWSRRNASRCHYLTRVFLGLKSVREVARFCGLSIRDLHRLRRRLGLPFELVEINGRMFAREEQLVSLNTGLVRDIALRASRIKSFYAPWFHYLLWSSADAGDNAAAG